jgi:predicted house-cleaning noncanonical NTP pyrophosphatase (MazG superfamily)
MVATAAFADQLYEEVIEFSEERDRNRETDSNIMELVRKIQQQSVRNGTDAMTLDEINAEIAAARAERRQRMSISA